MRVLDSQRIFGTLIAAACLTRVSSVRFYRLPQTFKLTSKEVDRVTTKSVWTCFANAEAYDPEWTHFYFDASSSGCSLRSGLVSFDFMALSPMGTPGAPLSGNFYVKDVAGRLATVDGCPAEIVLRDLVCALPEPLPPGQVDCSALEGLVQITSANETALTNALFRGKCSEYGREFYSTTSPYHRFVASVLWNKTLTVADRIELAAAELDAVAPDGAPTKEKLLALPVGGWGTICDFLACAKLRFPSAAVKQKTSANRRLPRYLCTEQQADAYNYFYTTNINEAKQTTGYTYDGIAGRILPAKAPNSIALYRLFHAGRQAHFYTTSQTERADAISMGYKAEGIAGYVYEASGDTRSCPCSEVRPLYRLVKNAPEAHYVYTMNAAAVDKAAGYKYEKIEACIYPS